LAERGIFIQKFVLGSASFEKPTRKSNSCNERDPEPKITYRPNSRHPSLFSSRYQIPKFDEIKNHEFQNNHRKAD